jgi:hypothetical protein
VLILLSVPAHNSATSVSRATSNFSRGCTDSARNGKRDLLEDADLSEAQKIRRLQVMVSMVMSVISQDPNLTVEEASELVAGTKRAALAMFPDKELAYDILYKPRLQRLMRERFHLQ